MNNDNHFYTCSAPICPLSTEKSKDAIWYPDEKICGHKPYTKWQIKQRKIQELYKRGLCDQYRYFTIESLMLIKRVRPGIKGEPSI